MPSSIKLPFDGYARQGRQRIRCANLAQTTVSSSSTAASPLVFAFLAPLMRLTAALNAAFLAVAGCSFYGKRRRYRAAHRC